MFTTHLSNKNVFITGGTGFIGGGLIAALKSAGANVICYGRSLVKIAEKYGDQVIATDTFEHAGDRIDYIIHAACPTASSELAAKPIEVIESVYNLTKCSLELARKTSARYIFLSSMEVYDGLNGDVHEDDIGKCDLSRSRSAYPMGKQFAELLVNSYHNEYNLDTVIVRLAQVFGPGATLNDSRFFNFIIKKCLLNEPIVLNTTGEKWHNSCFIEDAVFYILNLLSTDATGTFNVATTAYCNTINSLAESIIKILGSKSILEHELLAVTDFRPDFRYKISNEKIQQMFPEHQSETFASAIVKTADYFRTLLGVS